jgi:hypothetical protein
VLIIIADVRMMTITTAVIKGLLPKAIIVNAHVNSRKPTVWTFIFWSQRGSLLLNETIFWAMSPMAAKGHIMHQNRPASIKVNIMSVHHSVHVKTVATFLCPSWISENPRYITVRNTTSVGIMKTCLK